MSTTRRMAWNALTIWLSSLTAALVAMAVVPLLMSHLGEMAYGLVLVVTTVITVATMADLGLRGALMRQLSAEVARGDQQRVNEYFSASLTWLLFVGVTFGALCWLTGSRFVAWLGVPPELESSALFLVRYYVAVQTASWLAAPVFSGVVEAHHRFDLSNLIHTAEVLLRGTLLLVTVGWAELGVYGWFWAMTISKLAALIALVVAARQVCPSLRYQPWRIQWRTCYELVAMGGLVFLYWSVSRLSTQVDPLILGKLLGMDASALYEPARLAVMSAFPFVAVVVRQIIPMAAGFHALGQSDRLRDALIRGTRWTLLLATPFLIAFGCFAGPIIRLVWLGEGFEITALCLTWWAFAELLFYLNGPQWHIMLGVGRIRLIVWVEFFAAALNMLASIACVIYLREAGWGDKAVLGVIFPTIVARVFLRIGLTIYTTRVIGVPLLVYIRQGYVRPLAILLLLVCVALVVRATVEIDSIASLILGLLVPMLLWVVCTWLFVLDELDRTRLAGLLRWRNRPTSS